MEDLRNIYATCSDCAAKPQQKFMTWDINTFVNKWIKKSFCDKSTDITEHLWIKISKVNDDKISLTGTIDNDPVLDSGVKFGDTVQVNLDEIEECFDGEKLL